MIDIGFLAAPGRTTPDPYATGQLVAVAGGLAEDVKPEVSALPSPGSSLGGGGRGVSPFMRQCPKCGGPSLVRQEGCDTCTSCDYSKCA
jgi:ribonucleoside-diphosphate reductase alpha chain